MARECFWIQQFDKNHYKVLLGGIFLNWCTNDSYRSWILDSINTLKFTNGYHLYLIIKFETLKKKPPKFDYKQNTNPFWVKIVILF
jgi:hypothetical protein